MRNISKTHYKKKQKNRFFSKGAFFPQLLFEFGAPESAESMMETLQMISDITHLFPKEPNH